MGAAGTDISHAALRERGGVLLPPPATRVNASGYLSCRCFKAPNALLGEKIEQFFLGKGSKALTGSSKACERGLGEGFEDLREGSEEVSEEVSGEVRRPRRRLRTSLGEGSKGSGDVRGLGRRLPRII